MDLRLSRSRMLLGTAAACALPRPLRELVAANSGTAATTTVVAGAYELGAETVQPMSTVTKIPPTDTREALR